MARRIWPDDYLDAGLERMNDAVRLYQNQRYGAALYLAGVAAESVIRAYRTRRNQQFDAGHDLVELLKGCRPADFGKRRAELGAAIKTFAWIWRNDYRYSSEELIQSRLAKRKLARKVEGNAVKAYCHKVIEAAEKVVKIG